MRRARAAERPCMVSCRDPAPTYVDAGTIAASRDEWAGGQSAERAGAFQGEKHGRPGRVLIDESFADLPISSVQTALCQGAAKAMTLVSPRGERGCEGAPMFGAMPPHARPKPFLLGYRRVF